MIAFEKALPMILSRVAAISAVEKSIYEINSNVLAEDIRAKENLPRFSNSAMDGFAVRTEEIQSPPARLKIKGVIKAGDYPKIHVKNGEAVKIMKGAALLEGLDAIVIMEDTEEQREEVLVKKAVGKGKNVRLEGEEIRKGQIALKKGTRLNPSSAGFLAALGRRRVKVLAALGYLFS